MENKVMNECMIIAEMVYLSEKESNPVYTESQLYYIRVGAMMGAMLSKGVDVTANGFDATYDKALKKLQGDK